MARTIPTTDFDFNVTQDIISKAAMTNMIAWGLDTDWMNTVIDPKKKIWESSWAAYADRKARNNNITLAKCRARKDYEFSLRQLIHILQHNTHITVEELAAMGIVIRTNAHPHTPVASTYPDHDIDCSMIRRLVVNYKNTDSLRKARPHGQRGMVIRWMIRDTEPAQIEDLINVGFDSRSPFVLEFDEPNRGKKVYFCMCWENTRGEKGPWGKIFSAIIP
jgi:hypothetical protein